MSRLSLACVASSVVSYCYAAGMRVSNCAEITMMHPYGSDLFPQIGAVFIDTPSTRGNALERWIVMFARQELPSHIQLERLKDISVLKGSLFSEVDSIESQYHHAGEDVVIPIGSYVRFQAAEEGCILRTQVSSRERNAFQWSVLPDARVRRYETFSLTDGIFLPILGCMQPRRMDQDDSGLVERDTMGYIEQEACL